MDLHRAAAAECCRFRDAPHAFHKLQPWAAAEGKKGQADCDEGGLVTGPEVGLSSGCCVGPELIEGES